MHVMTNIFVNFLKIFVFDFFYYKWSMAFDIAYMLTPFIL